TFQTPPLGVRDALSTYARGPDTLEPESLTCNPYLASYLAMCFEDISPRTVLVNF
ncbi:hypothetical protein L208DRAFT_1393103, partial [Tricholoma matsutake]